MKRIHTILLVVLSALTLVALPSGATIVQLELYNTYPLSNYNGSAVLQGDSTSGDLVQVILAGTDGAIDAPSTSGGPGGDDVLLFTSWVGWGMPVANTGQLDQWPLEYDLTLAGTNVYVRFFDASTAGAATYYGNSSIFVLPVGDGMNQASLDFVPLAGSPHAADQPAEFSIIPEPSDMFLFGVFIVGCWLWRHRNRYGIGC
jgi:hypothetical protein